MEQMENYVSRNSGADTCLSGTCIKSTDNEQYRLYAHRCSFTDYYMTQLMFQRT